MSFVKDDKGYVHNTDDSYYRILLSDRNQKKQNKDLQEKLNSVTSEIDALKDLINKVISRD